MNSLASYFKSDRLENIRKATEKCNSFTEAFGLSLTEKQMNTITEKRFEALERTGRTEFGEGITEKLILAFRDSHYIYQGNYEESIIELQELFYYFKNECGEALSDDELLFAMALIFNTIAGGSTEYLAGVSGEEMIEISRTKTIDYGETENEECD